MAPTLEAARERSSVLAPADEALLSSPRAPIVLAPRRPGARGRRRGRPGHAASSA